MSETALNNLRDYLCGTLTKEDMAWLSTELALESMEDEDPTPYTMDEINAMIDEGERQFANGEWQYSDDMFRELEEKLNVDFLNDYAKAV